jgi:predicted CXXCH cytochrome family protein
MKDAMMRRPVAADSPPVILFFVALGIGVAATAGAQNNCVECHSALDDETLSHPARAMSNDVHATAGLSCVDCHGGDASAAIVGDDDSPAKAPGTGFVGAPHVAEIPAYCGRCHADAAYMQDFDPNFPVDQLAQYWTSGHGTRLQDGALDVATCVSCHGTHGMLSAQDPTSPVYPTKIADTCGTCHADDDYMSESDLDTDQVELYRQSVHGTTLYDQGDLSAPTCNDCHGNHGAAPPQVGSVSLVCGNCHAIQRELFSQGPHKEKFEALGDPECESCHSNHNVRPATDDFLGVGDEQVCSNCHDEQDEAWDIAIALRADIEDLKATLARATETVDGAAVAGMEMSDAEHILIDANQRLVQARNVVHAVSLEALRAETDEGRALADEAQQMGIAAFEELQFRRKGLAVSVLFILLVVAGLYLKIRQIESNSKHEGHD